MVELLAPAGNSESFDAALNNGADAVYLGLYAHNARGNIQNFTLEKLREIVERAHLFGVRVFLTLNTLVFDDEFEDLIELVRKTIAAKVDAYIVQDIGLAYLLRNKFPEIELHASTQMGIQNIEGVNFLKPLGYKRVVLARETTLSEIKRIKEGSDVEIEYFVQGALCVSYSGNCYLCSLLANASGNRGKCKQFCRLPVEMNINGMKKEGYLLSTKDFCMLPCLKELIESGVTSLKIEGRARRPAYVAGAVKVYRDALDNNLVYSNKSIETLKKLFNRGNYISGYFKNEKILYSKTQNHMGVEIGKILSFKKGKRFNEVTIFSSHNLSKGDALKFFVDEKEIASLSVQDVKYIGKNKYLFTTTTSVTLGAKVNLIVDNALEKDLLSAKRKIEVGACFEGRVGQNAVLSLQSGEIKVTLISDEVLAQSKDFPLTAEECKKQISKLGDEFNLTSFDAALENVFMAKSQLNALRRAAIEKLKEKIIEKNENKLNIKEKEFNLKIQKNIQKNKKIIYFNSLQALENQINSDNYLIFEPNEYKLNEIKEFCQKYPNKLIYLSLPVLANEKMINELKNLYISVSNLGVLANNYYAFSLTTPDKTIVGSEMNVANSYAVEFYLTCGYNKIILSKEDFDFSFIKNGDAQLFVETDVHKKLMHFRHCPFKENLGGDCGNCKFCENATYSIAGKTFEIKRQRLGFCQFVLTEKEKSTSNNFGFGTVQEG